MSIVDVIANAIWEGFEADPNAHADRKMDVIDTSGHFEALDMGRVAEHVTRKIEESRLITTVEQLEALSSPSERIPGALIQTLTPGDPHRYEQNADGSWCITGRPDEHLSWEDRSIPPRFIELPAVLLWEQPRGDVV